MLAVLARLVGSEVQEREAAEMARLLEAEYRDLEERVARAEDLPRRIELADKQARRRSAGPGPGRTGIGLRCPVECGRSTGAFADQTRRREQEERRSALKDRCSEHRSAGAVHWRPNVPLLWKAICNAGNGPTHSLTSWCGLATGR